MTPSVPIAKRLAAIMHRRLSTHWSDQEIRQYRKLVKDKCFDSEEDIALIERYYAFERRKGERGVHRRDLMTLLRNWQSEVDRAVAWDELHPIKPKERKIIPLPPQKDEPYIAPTDPDTLAAIARFEKERERRKSAFQQCKEEMSK